MKYTALVEYYTETIKVEAKTKAEAERKIHKQIEENRFNSPAEVFDIVITEW